jgi:hypothetical protein
MVFRLLSQGCIWSEYLCSSIWVLFGFSPVRNKYCIRFEASIWECFCDHSEDERTRMLE